MDSNGVSNVFLALLQEAPPDKVIWKTLDGSELTAGQLAKEVSQGSLLGKQYVSEVLRIVTSILTRNCSS